MIKCDMKVKCPDGQVCRAHRKLGSGSAQCVSTSTIDIDAFCEDRLSVQSSMVEACSPFSTGSKQLVQCNLKDVNGSLQIKPLIKHCPGFDVCRSYGGTAQCVPPLQALCQDRFYQMFNQVKEPRVTFSFCDPYQPTKRIECSMSVSPEPILKSIQVLDIQGYAQMQEMVKLSSEKLQYLVSDIQAHHITCNDGLVCVQMSPTENSCRQKLSNLNTKKDFCQDKEEPGQYCLAGTPDIGVICPAGQVVQCPRPVRGDPADWNDLNPQVQHCTQQHGKHPEVDMRDPFRRPVNKVVDSKRQQVLFGWYASCQQ